MTVLSTALANAIINMNQVHETGSDIVRLKGRHARIVQYIGIARQGAKRYEREHPGIELTDFDLLYAAATLAEHYAQ